MSSALGHSPVELKQRMPVQSSPAVQSEARQARTMLGTRPSIVTRASWMNLAKSGPVGAPRKSAIVARFTSDA